ncbi:hypothetical protein MNEG_7388 [Monoraphidium neglectum]|uniref:CCZ1/INTU/HSP4 first Longin domain-containing protein n=1 Tax=Monoraphidium neglectum TaxID=145388 RepID=A0A0D2MBC9_9CHLO|nr:hypothetical protein MNEG_7388 [Monoraphidium neglectum]KIZ00575.1 hypothetical protein MNEG_7388 [Monoraphidium neglectum]|eukprot:XP_013899594.1 hypothetical protein MNEG_7388 [Monoraphidium neglectum]
MASSATRSSGPGRWLSGHFTVCLAVYDTRRGQAEGCEADKILGFYPPSAPPAMQSSIVGLAHAVTMFAGTFNKDGRVHSMETDNNLWAMLNCEPGVWLLMVASRAWCGAAATPDGLAACLRTVHALAALLHGGVNAQLEADPGAASVRRRLQPLLQEVASRLLRPETREQAAISCPLAARGGAPLLRAPRGAFALLQAIVSRLLAGGGGGGGGRAVQGVVACYGQHLLWSTLGPGDTAALFALAARGVLPAVRAGPRHRTARPPVGAAAAPAGGPGVQQLQHGGGGAGGEAGGSGGSSGVAVAAHNLINPAYWELREDGLVQPAGTANGGERGAAAAGLPTVWLQDGQEPSRLLVWHTGPLVFLILLHEPGAAAGAGAGASSGGVPAQATAVAAAAAARQLRERAPRLAELLRAELPAKHVWHVPGLRYHFADGQAGTERASPLSKVGTLSLASLAAAADAKAATDLEVESLADPTPEAPWPHGTGEGSGHMRRRHERRGDSGGGGGGSGPGGRGRAPQRHVDPGAWTRFMRGEGGGSAEVVLRCAHDCTVAVRHACCGGGAGGSNGGGGSCGCGAGGGQRLVAVAEGEKDRAGLPSVMGQVDALCDMVCPGALDGVS